MRRRDKKYVEFRSLLIEARKTRGLTQVELGKKLGKPQNFVSKFESGEPRLDVVEFVCIAKALGIEPTAIVKKLADEI